MLSAERASVHGISQQQHVHEMRVRNSMMQAVTVPYGAEGLGRRGTAQSIHQSRRSSFQRVPTNPGLASNIKIKGINKFEIVLEKRARPVEVEKALGLYRRDSLSSIQKGTAVPSIKNYVDLDAESFEPGEAVKGHVLLVLSQKVSVTCIHIKLKGIYIVAYLYKQEGESTTSTEQLTFLEADASLKTNPETGEAKLLNPGAYRYDFLFKLPLNIPGTLFFERFEEVYEGASVVYSLEAELEMDHSVTPKLHSPIAKDIIHVRKRVPDRLDTKLHKPSKVSKAAEISFCCYNMGKIILNVALNQMIFTEGSTMIIDIQLVNESKKKVHELDVALVQYGSYKNKNLTKCVLKSRKTLLAHKLPLDDMQYGDAEQQLAFTLPDDMQPSTVLEIVPPSSHFQKLALATEASEAGPSNQDGEQDKAGESGANVDQIDVKMPTKDKDETDYLLDEDSYLLLEQDYQLLYEVSYYVQVKAKTTTECFNMKGPEVHFPIMVESADIESRKRNAGDISKQIENITAADIEKEKKDEMATEPAEPTSSVPS